MRNAKRRSESPLERRVAGVPVVWTAVASAMVLEGRQGLVDRRLRLLHGVGRRLTSGEGVVDVVVDRLGYLRIDRRDGPRLGLCDGLLELVRERQRLLDLRVVVRRTKHWCERELRRIADVGLERSHVVDDGECGTGILRVDRDDRVVAAEDAGLAAALEGRLRSDLKLALYLRRRVVLAERIGIGPVAHEGVLSCLPRRQRLGLHVGRDGLGSGPVLHAVDHELQRLDRLRGVDRGLRAVGVKHLPAGGEHQLEEVAGEPLIGGALVDDAAVLGRLLVHLLPGRRDLLDLVVAVVEEARVRRLRHAKLLVLERDGLKRRLDEVRLAALDVRRHVVQPLLRRKLRGPDDVGGKDVALARLRLLALDELLALGIGGSRELEDLHRDAGVLGVIGLDPRVRVAGSVLAGAIRDLALGALHRVRVDLLDAGGLIRPAARLGPAATAAASAVVTATAGGYDEGAQGDGQRRAQTKATSHATPPTGTYIYVRCNRFQQQSTGPVSGPEARSSPARCQGLVIDVPLGWRRWRRRTGAGNGLPRSGTWRVTLGSAWPRCRAFSTRSPSCAARCTTGCAGPSASSGTARARPPAACRSVARRRSGSWRRSSRRRRWSSGCAASRSAPGTTATA